VGLILGSVGPWSVGAYLGFALGDGAGLDERDGGDEEEMGVWGLEVISRKRVLSSMTGEDEDEHEEGHDPSSSSVKQESRDEGMTIKQEVDDETEDHPMKCSATSAAAPRESGIGSGTTHPIHPNETLASSTRSISSSHRYTHERPKFFYGPVGDKIGEACMAWLARWAVDLLDVEEGFVQLDEDQKKRAGSGSGGGAGAEVPANRAGRVTFDRNADEEDGSTVGRKGRGLSSSLPEDTSGRRPRSVSWQPDLSAGSSSAATGSRSRGAGTREQPDSIDARLKSTHVKFNSMSGSVVAQQQSGSAGQPTSSAQETGRTSTLTPLKIWGHGGLPAAIVRGVISSDALFISDEVERYAFAKRVIALRQEGRERARDARMSARTTKREDAEGGAALFIRTSVRSRYGKDSKDPDDVGLGKLHLGVKEEEEEDQEHIMGDDTFEEEEDMLREEEDDEDAELNDVFRSGIYYSHMVSRREESMWYRLGLTNADVHSHSTNCRPCRAISILRQVYPTSLSPSSKLHFGLLLMFRPGSLATDRTEPLQLNLPEAFRHSI